MSEADAEGGAASQCASAWKVKHAELKRRNGHTHTHTHLRGLSGARRGADIFT